jgi:Tol biopolymer transport system component
MRRLGRVFLVALIAVPVAGYVALAARAPKTRRVDVSSSGVQAKGGASGARTGEAISANGRFVAFASDATNLVPNDTNHATDIFVRDLKRGTTRRVSVGPSGRQANGPSFDPSISADGRFIAFATDATNLVPGGTTGEQVFVRDLRSNTTHLVSADSSGHPGNGASFTPSISADGRFVAFASNAASLIPGGTTHEQVFVRNMKAGHTSLVSQSSSGKEANGPSFNPSIAADGKFVAFASDAGNLVSHGSPYANVFVRNLKAATTRLASAPSSGHPANGNSYTPSISAGGRFVAFVSSASNLVSGDTNRVPDVFVRNLSTRSIVRVSVSSSGRQGNRPSLLVDPALTANGRFITFTSQATNLVSHGVHSEQVFLRAVAAHKTTLVSESSSGNAANAGSFDASISADGKFVAFDSLATNLVAGDTNGVQDVFVRGPLR